MKQFDLIVLGFGKGGKTLTKVASSLGKKVAMVEQSQEMYGGTCINIGCIPSKTLVHEGLANSSFDQAIERKVDVVSALNKKSYHNLAYEDNITVFNYKAAFKSNTEVDLLDEAGNVVETLTAEHTVINSGAVPYTVFIDPPLSSVGLTAKEAEEQRYEIKEGKLPVNSIPRHKVNNDPRGLFKTVIDTKTDKILGATLYGKQSEEMINIVKLAIDQKLDYGVLRDNIYTHPTMIESFNDLFNI